MNSDYEKYGRAWYIKNRERMAEMRRQRRKANPEKSRKDSRRYYMANRERVLDRIRQSRLIRQFGITAQEYDAILIQQGGKCAICKCEPNGRKLAVDHCHDSKRVRGLLCHNCNAAIGLLNDDPGRLCDAINYLTPKFAVIAA